MSSQTSKTKVCLESILKSKNWYIKKVSFKCLVNKSNLIHTSTELKNHKIIPRNKMNGKFSVTLPFVSPQKAVKAEKADNLQDYWTKVKRKHMKTYSTLWLSTQKKLLSMASGWWRADGCKNLSQRVFTPCPLLADLFPTMTKILFMEYGWLCSFWGTIGKKCWKRKEKMGNRSPSFQGACCWLARLLWQEPLFHILLWFDSLVWFVLTGTDSYQATKISKDFYLVGPTFINTC